MIDSKERARRFKDARTIYNVHGNQGLKAVYEATRVSQSMISDLESSVGKDRPVQYQKVVALAEHYGVNVAWLMGQSESHKINEDRQIVAKTTGLSDKATEMLQIIKKSDLIRILNLLLESEDFAVMLMQFRNALVINTNNTQSDEEAELIENLQMWGIANGMDSKNSKLSNRQLIDMYRRKAVESINRSFHLIMKEEKNNGKRNEEN